MPAHFGFVQLRMKFPHPRSHEFKPTGTQTVKHAKTPGPPELAHDRHRLVVDDLDASNVNRAIHDRS